MTGILLAFGIGALAGYVNMFRRAGGFVAGPLSTAGIVLLLFFMGIKIGSDAEIMNSLAVMGLEALLYAVVGIAGSVLAVWLWQRLSKKTAGQPGKEA